MKTKRRILKKFASSYRLSRARNRSALHEYVRAATYNFDQQQRGLDWLERINHNPNGPEVIGLLPRAYRHGRPTQHNWHWLPVELGGERPWLQTSEGYKPLPVPARFYCQRKNPFANYDQQGRYKGVI